jgi:short subunit dehydrogenase-like uncharacterized protein
MAAVFGATGHTGRFVVAELSRRDITPIAIARDAAALEAASFSGLEVLRRRHATVEDARSLDRAIDGAEVVVNCAGPFVDTADALVAAALRAGIHYVDICAEQAAAHNTLARYGEPAREVGIAVVPSMAFYGGFVDLMVTAAMGDWDAADSIEIMIGLENWHPTPETRNTIERSTGPRMVVIESRLSPLAASVQPKRWDFGDHAVLEVPVSETILISRHVRTTELHNYINQLAIADVLDPATPAPKAGEKFGRSRQRFVVEALIVRGGMRRRAIVRGRDIYAVSAPLVCEAVQRLLEGRFRAPGAQAPGEIFDAEELLAALAPEHATFEVIAV